MYFLVNLAMTLSERNALFKVGIVFCALSALLILAASFFIVPLYSSLEENTFRPTGFFNLIASRFMDADYLSVHISLVMMVLFSLVGIILVYSFFEQTSAPEILYIAFFIISFSFETVRLILPLYLLFDIPSFYLLTASRILFFTRYFGFFSLFAAGIYAAGLDMQEARYVIMVLFIAALAITFSTPIDTQRWDTSLNIIMKYNSISRLIEIAAFFTTVISFFIAVNIRSSKEYAYIGIGAILALTGRYLLISSDNWVFPAPGILMLSLGTWFVCSKLHKINLWL